MIIWRYDHMLIKCDLSVTVLAPLPIARRCGWSVQFFPALSRKRWCANYKRRRPHALAVALAACASAEDETPQGLERRVDSTRSEKSGDASWVKLSERSETRPENDCYSDDSRSSRDRDQLDPMQPVRLTFSRIAPLEAASDPGQIPYSGAPYFWPNARALACGDVIWRVVFEMATEKQCTRCTSGSYDYDHMEI